MRTKTLVTGLMILLVGTMLATVALGMGKALTVAEANTEQIPVETALPISALPDIESNFDKFIFGVEKRSKGALELVLQPTAGDVFQRVANGEFLVGHGLPSQTGMVEGTFFSGIPFGFEPKEHVKWLLNGGGLELQRDIYEPRNVVPVPVCAIPEGGGMFLEALPSTVGEFEATGWTLRWFGLGKEVLSMAFPNLNFAVDEAGANPLKFFGDNWKQGYLFPQLQGFEYSSPNNDLHLLWNIQPTDPTIVNPAEARGMYYYNTWHQPTIIVEFWFNKDYWDSLSSEEREAIDRAGRKTLLSSLRISQQRSLQKIQKSGMMTDIDWPENLRNYLKQETLELYNVYREIDRVGDILDSMIEFGWDLYPD